jgi:heptosyltransferase-3
MIKESKAKKTKILIICVKHLGDLVTTTSVIPILKDNFQNCDIHYAVFNEALPLIENHPDVTKTYAIKRHQKFSETWRLMRELRKEKYDFVLDFSEGTRGAKLSLMSGGTTKVAYKSEKFHPFRNVVPTILLPPRSLETERPVTVTHADFAAVLGATFQKVPLPKIYHSKEASVEAKLYLESIGVIAHYSVAHFTATDDIRLWPSKHAANAVDWLSKRLGAVLLVSSGTEKEMSFLDSIKSKTTGKVVNTGALPLDILMAILEKADIFIGLDSLVGHMAGALGTPLVSIFGPSREKHWAPRGPLVKIAHMNLPCRSCVKGGCLGNNLSRCLEELDFEEYVEPLLEDILRDKSFST